VIPGIVHRWNSAILVLLVVSAFFSSAEIAVVSLPSEWIDEREDAGDERASVLSGLRADPHRLLVTLLVGNNIVNVAISSITTVLLVRVLSEGAAVTVATLESRGRTRTDEAAWVQGPTDTRSHRRFETRTNTYFLL